MTFWIFLGIGSGSLFALLLANFFNFVGKEKNESPDEENNGESKTESLEYETVNYQTLGFFFMSFGYLGALMYYYSFPMIIIIPLSAAGSFFISYIVSRLDKFTKSKKSAPNQSDLIGSAGIALSDVTYEKNGEIEIIHSGIAKRMNARSFERKVISSGNHLIISEIDVDGIPLVTEFKEKT